MNGGTSANRAWYRYTVSNLGTITIRTKGGGGNNQLHTEQLYSPETNWASGAVSGKLLRVVVVFFHQDFQITCVSVAPGFVFRLVFINSLLGGVSCLSVWNGYSFTGSLRELYVFTPSLLRFD